LYFLYIYIDEDGNDEVTVFLSIKKHINSDRKKGIRISLKTSPKQSIWQLAEQAQFLHSCHLLLNKKAESVLGRWRVIMPFFQAICHLFYILNFFLFLP